MGSSVIPKKLHKKSTSFSTALRVLSISMVLIVLGLVTVVQAQVILPRYQQGAYNPNVLLPHSRLCKHCADGSVPSGSWAVSLDSPSIASDTLSFAINLHPVTDVPAGGTSTSRDFVTTFQMHLEFAAGITGLTQTGCTRTFGSEFTRTKDSGLLYTHSSEANLQSGGSIVASSIDAASPVIPGYVDRFAQLPESSSDALLVATVTCPIASSAGVAGVSFLGSGYNSNNKRLTTQDSGSYNQEVLTIASSNLLNYPLDGTTQYLTRVDIHSDGAGADLHFAQSVPSSLNNINNVAFRLNSSDVASYTSVPSYTSQVVDADTLRYRFGGGVVLSGGQELQVTRNSDYYGISATTLTAIPYEFYADAPYITSTPTVNASNTQVTVAFNTSVYNDPVSASAFRLVLTTTSSAVSLATVSSVTTTSNAGEYVLTVNTLKSAMGTERFNVELVLDGIGAGASPYRAAYPYQTTATNIAFNNLAFPVITSVTVFGDTPYGMSRDVRVTVSDTEGIMSVGFTQSTLSVVQACASTDTTLISNVQPDGGSSTNAVAIHTFAQTTIDPVFVCAFAIDSDNNRSTATTAMVVVITNIDRDPPTIVIDGPPSNISTNVTITGMVSNQETTSNSVSGLASFGYVVQVIDDACTTTTMPTTTLTNPATNPHVPLVFTTTENGVRLCFIAIDNAGNVRAVASSVTESLDIISPQIEITGPSTAISSMATITGRVISSETVSTAVSGLASFGYVMQAIDDACTTTTVPTITLINPATNPNVPLLFITTENGVRLCFIAIDNVGNARAVASSVTEKLDVIPPQIEITDPSTAVSSMATITGRIVSSEVISTTVSGLASFGYVVQTIDDACTTATTPTTTLTNPAINPNASLVFTTTENGVYLCFIAIDNVGNARASVSQPTTRVDAMFPQIEIIGPPVGASSMATIIGRVVSSETVSATVSGLASFGYVVQAIDNVCTTTTMPITTLTNPDTNPSVPLVFTTTENGVNLCFIAIDNVGNARAVASSVTERIDVIPPQIEITDPSTAVSSMATITGRVISSETVSTAVSGLASFGYVVQEIDDACTTTTMPTTTLTNPAANPNAYLLFTTTKNGVRLCFIAIDNAGNARAVVSQSTTRVDANAPRHPGVLSISSENSVLEIVYIGTNNIAFTTASQMLNNRGVRVDVLNPDSVRGVTLSTVTVSGKTLRIEVIPTDTSTGSGVFTVDGVRGVLVDGNGIARSRAGVEDYRVTIIPNTIQDIVGNIVQVAEEDEISLVQNSSPVLVTLGSRGVNGEVVDVDAKSTRSSDGSIFCKFCYPDGIQ